MVGRTSCSAEQVDCNQDNPLVPSHRRMQVVNQEPIGEGIVASGLMNRIKRPNTNCTMLHDVA